MRAAARWYAKAARRGDAKAAAIVGACYWNEEGVKRNSGTACRYVRLSTVQHCSAGAVRRRLRWRTDAKH
jgi:TPR repeat protein